MRLIISLLYLIYITINIFFKKNRKKFAIDRKNIHNFSLPILSKLFTQK